MKREIERWMLPFAALLCAVAIALSLPAVSRVTDSGIQGRRTTVLVDAGHGGFDGGASAADGTLEKDINLQISKNLAAMLRVMGYGVTETRREDRGLNGEEAHTIREKKVSDMHRRLEMYEGADAVISIHQNHFSESKYHGAQVFYAPQNAKSQPFAAAVREKVIELVQPQNTRELKKADSGVYLMANTTVPAVLVECGFLSNPAECELLQQAEHRGKIAWAVTVATCGFLAGES